MHPNDTTNDISQGICQCGCGRKTNIAKDGTQNMFVNGHNQRKQRNSKNPNGTKACQKCLVEKPFSEYWKNSSRGDGYNSWCHECMNAYARVHRNKPENIQKIRAQRRAYNKLHSRAGLPSRKTPYRIVAKWYNNNPGARAAHQAVHKAAKTGVIPHISTQTCAQCGSRATQYHHHLGYSAEHQLDVIPLCPTCHREAHIKTL